MAENLQELITKSRPTAKQNTIKIYERNIKYVMKGLKATDYSFLKNLDEVMSFLSNKHYTTQRNYLNALIILMLALNHDKTYDEWIKKYDEQREKLTEQYDKDQENHIISDKQKPNFISFQELKDIEIYLQSLSHQAMGKPAPRASRVPRNRTREALRHMRRDHRLSNV